MVFSTGEQVAVICSSFPGTAMHTVGKREEAGLPIEPMPHANVFMTNL